MRTLLVFFARNVFAHIPFLKRRYAVYTESVPPSDVGETLVDHQFDESFELTQAQYDYLDNLSESSKPYFHDGKLRLKKRFIMTEVKACAVLGQIRVPVHVKSERLLTQEHVGRNMIRMFHYRYIEHLDRLGISLTSTVRGHSHYYHFVLQRLVDLVYALERVPEARHAVVLVRRGAPGFQEVAFDFLASKYPGLSFKHIARHERINCDRLLVIENIRNGPINNLGGGEAIRQVRKLYLEAYGIEEKPMSRLVFISRSRQKQRRMLNENTLVEQLKPLGFEVVHPELLSHKEQVELFSSARMVIGSTGGAMTNLLFCQPGCKVIEIRPENYDYPLFLGLCKQMNLSHHHFAGSETSGKDMFSVDIDRLCGLIGDIGAQT